MWNIIILLVYIMLVNLYNNHNYNYTVSSILYIQRLHANFNIKEVCFVLLLIMMTSPHSDPIGGSLIAIQVQFDKQCSCQF